MTAEYENIAVIGFDLDETLYPKTAQSNEVIQGYIHRRIASHRNVPLDEAKALFDELYLDGQGMSGRRTLETLGIPHASIVIQEALDNADIASFLRPDEETIALLGDLKRKYHGVDLITGSSLSQVHKKLDALGIPSGTFNHLITDEVAAKSDASAYGHWMALYEGFAPTDFLYVGNFPTLDYACPRTLGVRSILVNREEVNESLFCPQLRTLSEIRALLL